MKSRFILIGVGAIIMLGIAGRVIAQPAGPEEVAIDTTGASAQATAGGQAPQAISSRPQGANTAARAADSTTGAAEASASPAPVQVQTSAISLERKPLLLLNPSTVRQGSSVGVTGSNFDAGATIDVVLKQREDDQGQPITFVQVDKSGGFGGVNFAVPDSVPRGSFIIEARQRNSDRVARALGVVAGGAPLVKLGTQVGKPGDEIQLSAQGFGPDEDVKVYWNGLSGKPVATLRSDGGGGIREGSVRVPFGAVGNNSFVFVGEKSQSPVTLNFLMLNLFPTVELSSYAIKPDNVLSFTGKDFGPEERVLVYLNTPDSRPLTTIQSNAEGGFTNAGGFVVPFGLRGKQTMIFVGEQSRAPTTAGFDTLPYTPNAQPSTYGGRPGTAITFYGAGFARSELVHVYVGRTRDNPGQLVSCFRTDDLGNAGSAGSFVIPGNAQGGQLVFSLVGRRSEATATAAVEVTASDLPLQIPPQSEFKCSLDDDSQTSQDGIQSLPAASQQEQPGQ